MNSPIISISNLSKRYRIGPDRMTMGEMMRGIKRAVAYRLGLGLKKTSGDFIWALRDVSLDIAEGERVGIIGRNGAGKSTLLKVLSRVTYPTSGEARIYGRVTSLLEVGTGFSDDLTGRENIFLNAALYGLSRKQIEARLDDIINFSEIRRFIDTPIKHYSSGMRMRLAFSVAAHLDPDVLMLDEVLAVGDLSFQKKCLERMGELTSHGRTLLFVSHDLQAVIRFCNRCVWLEQGQVIADGTVEEVTSTYLERYAGLKSEFISAAPPFQTPDARPSGRSDADRTPVTEEPADTVGEQKHLVTTTPVRLIAARVIDQNRNTTNSVRVDSSLGIEITFEVLENGANIEPAIHVKTTKEMAFAAAYISDDYPKGVEAAGRYMSTVWIPPNFLNVGLYWINIVLGTPDPLIRHVFQEDVLSFNVYETIDLAGTSRGRYARQFPGPVRPLLHWETEAAPSKPNPAAQIFPQ